MFNVSLRVFAQRVGLVVLFAAGLGLTPADRGEAAMTGVPPGKVVSPAVTSPAARASAETKRVTGEAFDDDAWDEAGIGSVDPRVFALALGAARCATSKQAVASPSTLTVIDYSKPSTKPRLWVYDLATRRLVYEELVAHGQGSGDNYASRFSNTPDSHQTSLGLFVTEGTYVGRNGYSLRLDGLDKGFNDRARERAIVMHGAPYVNDQISKSLGRIGRSHGCPAVREAVARELIDRVKGGSLVFAYYPDAKWLQSSAFLSGCDA